MYETKVTYLGNQWGCRILYNGVPVLEGRAFKRDEIGPVFRDLMRTLDKLGGDAYTSSSRKRKFKEGNTCISVKHLWIK